MKYKARAERISTMRLSCLTNETRMNEILNWKYFLCDSLHRAVRWVLSLCKCLLYGMGRRKRKTNERENLTSQESKRFIKHSVFFFFFVVYFCFYNVYRSKNAILLDMSPRSSLWVSMRAELFLFVKNL
jgi:hypothetical protein